MNDLLDRIRCIRKMMKSYPWIGTAYLAVKSHPPPLVTLGAVPIGLRRRARRCGRDGAFFPRPRPLAVRRFPSNPLLPDGQPPTLPTPPFPFYRLRRLPPPANLSRAGRLVVKTEVLP